MILRSAREAIGTPFHHQGRVLGVGIDCVGLLVHIRERLDLPRYDTVDYPPFPPGGLIDEHLLAAGFVPKAREDLTVGDVGVFSIGEKPIPRHVGVFTCPCGLPSMVHCSGGEKLVVEQALGDYWLRRLCHGYSFPST